ncbi:hemolysin expression modulator Hha [Citrobacter braakii]|uniref:Hemolysin expression modulator Hha n=1 Tax=Salmonella enterica subsp. enterica serovar Heidelberg TaxID=611 RepID=A0A733CHU1_SALET|nr:hemolysin expression modulator Hha [Escherichia coli]EAN0446580.1 hemolysin expression modulator Hha [Salmonella enterica]EDT3787428.1 hemolysin expression modulator Hha [Salmonella enterica subsp. enterica serovar Thompson]HAE5578710.1 hemolysin expression modulator Hha [Salmonella enterica subsp. enterica serovar Heidelberg]EAN4970971.1 hemolysin expression modulator Hha [Salmonella enterica]EAY0627631.1 hemolysin expression modulator Hha [Salmonella enterica]
MKTKTEWVLKLRRCSTTDTLQKVAERIKKRLSGKELGIFQLAADHRMAEITMQKLYDEVPFNVWKYIN